VLLGVGRDPHVVMAIFAAGTGRRLMSAGQAFSLLAGSGFSGRLHSLHDRDRFRQGETVVTVRLEAGSAGGSGRSDTSAFGASEQ